MRSPHVAVVDDNPAVLEALRLLLEREGFRVTTFDVPAALTRLDDVDLVLLDMNFTRDTTSGAEGLEAMKAIADGAADLPVILMTAWGSIDRAVEAMKLGARDYLTKPWDNARLLSACRAQLELSRARRRSRAHTRSSVDARGDFSNIVGSSPALVRAMELVADVAPTNATVLITGPPGTGKELLARAVHRNSARANRPWVAVNVGALVEGLFERELFGHVRGAFTDAREDRPGRFDAAHQGTLFLDEIGTLKNDQQLKLLRVLQEGEFEPVGSTRTHRVDVRVVAATNVDLAAEIAAGRFREDLYYRLQVVEVYLPPLRERPEDILPCARWFLSQALRTTPKPIAGLSPGAERALLSHGWPGNARELENAIQRAVIFCRGEAIEAADLPVTPAGPGQSPLGSLSEMERGAIRRALEEHAGNISKAASALGLSRAALYRRMAKYGLE